MALTAEARTCQMTIKTASDATSIPMRFNMILAPIQNL
jgi:hypothetical protein